MLLHSGSGLHRHEYSAPTSPTTTSSITKRATLYRSPFSSPATRPLPTRYDSSIKTPHPATFPASTDIRRPGVVSFVIEDKMKEDEAKETMSDDGKSMVSHEGSETTFGGDGVGDGVRKKRKKMSKVMTSYAIAHPAPTLRQKQQFVHLRPQLLLQLQRVSAATRPMPIVDVLPSAVFVPRLAKRFHFMFKGRGGLGPYDILCVKSEDYGTTMDRESSGSDSDDEGWASREVEAVICQTKRGDARAAGQAEIVFSSGSKWTAVPVSPSIYEFTSIDEHGLKTTARWVYRPHHQRSNSDMKEKIPCTPTKRDVKFNFSILDPRMRRHPIIASLTPNSLDIPDTYSLISPTSTLKTSLDTDSAALQENQSIHSADDKPEQSIKVVSESLRKLIQITGIWVALRQGWSPYFEYDDGSPCSTVRTPMCHNTPTSNASSSHRGRSVSLEYNTRNQKTDLHGVRVGAETPESTQGSFSSASGFSGKIKRISGHGHKGPRKDSGIDVVGDSNCGNTGRSFKMTRSSSAGAAFMAKVAAKRANTTGPPSTVASDSDGESLTHSPPRRAATSVALSSRSNLSVNEAGKGKRLSSPSPLSVVEPAGLGGDGTGVASPRPASLEPKSTLAAASASAALSGKAPKSERRGKTSKWGRFTGIFKKIR